MSTLKNINELERSIVMSEQRARIVCYVNQFFGQIGGEEHASVGFIVKEGWLLTTRSGTLGDTIYTLPCLNNFAVSEDAIRIELKNNSCLSNKYLFAFLKSSIGRFSLISGSYGSVILHLNEEYVGNISVPILDNIKVNLIENKIDEYIFKMNDSILKENQAIDLIEKEIDAWQ